MNSGLCCTCRPDGTIDDSQVGDTVEALEVGARLSEAAASGSRLAPAEQIAADKVLNTPIIAQVRTVSEESP